MISKSQISFIRYLHQKKFRQSSGLFIVEGLKSLSEFSESDYQIDTIFATENVRPKLDNLSQNVKIHEITASELGKISSLTTPQQALALVRIPGFRTLTTKDLKSSFSLALDGVQDPGNMGTIIRTADWFGIRTIICSEDTVDAYNPKVVQATMGSLARVSISYQPLGELISTADIPVYGAVLDGDSVYRTDFGNEGIIVLGNEGNGIRPAVMDLIPNKITIPNFGHAESLNVAISGAIICSEIRRKS